MESNIPHERSLHCHRNWEPIDARKSGHDINICPIAFTDFACITQYFLHFFAVACSRRSDSRARWSVGSKLNCTPGKRGGGRGGESEGTPVNILNNGSFQYTLLLVDYDTFCKHSSTGDIDEECDMERKRHLVIKSRDIEATINDAFPVCGIVLWRAENLFESRSPRPGRFDDFSNGLWETFTFQFFPRIMNIIKGNVGDSTSTIFITAPLVTIMKPSSSDLE